MLDPADIRRFVVALAAAVFVAAAMVAAQAARAWPLNFHAGAWDGSDGARYTLKITKHPTTGKNMVEIVRTMGPPINRKRVYKGQYTSGGFTVVATPTTIADFDPGIPAKIRALMLARGVTHKAKVRFRSRQEEWRIEYLKSRVTYDRHNPIKIEKLVRDVPDVTVVLKPVTTCGPDISEHVIRVLDRIYYDYFVMTPEWRASHCLALFGLQFNQAWDIKTMSPDEAKRGGFRRYARTCARPDGQCALSSNFLGHCIHMQVVNYIQWGLMTNLCKLEPFAREAHWARDTLVSAKWLRGKASGDHYRTQVMMVQLGKEYIDVNRRLTRNAGPGRRIPDQIKVMKATLERLIATARSRKNATWTEWKNRGQAKCPLQCKMSAKDKRRMRLLGTDYIWLRLGQERK